MRHRRPMFTGRSLALALCAATAVVGVGTTAHARTMPANFAQEQKQGEQKGKGAPSDAEQKAAQAVQAAADVQTTATAATEFVKKYPKSSLRPQVTRVVVAKIVAVSDPAQRATLAEGALKIFDKPDEVSIINPVLLNAYVDAKRYDDLFRVGGATVEKNPADVSARTQMALIGIDQARLGNAKFVPQSQQYAAKAVELIETNKKPAEMSDADWSVFKAEWLPQLYLSLGMLSYVSNNPADARTKLEKAMALGSADPTTYALLADMSDREYSDSASKINSMKAGAERDTATKQAQDKLDKVIELYAQAAALSEGKSGYEKMHDQLMTVLTNYYKYRKGSTDGLQQLIDKYKKPAAAQP